MKLRLACTLLAGLFFVGTAEAQFTRMEPAKLPSVRLSTQQVAKIQARLPNNKVVWHAAGRKPDGQILVCFVYEATPIIGPKLLNIWAGIFEKGDSFDTIWGGLNNRERLRNCRLMGINPPFYIRP